MSFKICKVVFDSSVRELCHRPYPGHRRGCPNFGKKKGCPPGAPLFTEIIDQTYPVFAIWNIFDLTFHRSKMRSLHPRWSDRQLDCCLYWQPRARKYLDGEIWLFQLQESLAQQVNSGTLCHPYLILKCPEAHGINITQTMRNIGELLEWPAKTKTYQVAIAGKSK